MFKNYLRIAWRHLVKNRISAFINIIGLTIGMAVTMLIGLWVWDECNFDHYHVLHKRLAEVYDNQTWNGKTTTDREVDIPLKDKLMREYTGDFRRMALFSPAESGHLLLTGDKKLTATGIYAEPDFPEMLTLAMRFGSREGLMDPSSVLLAVSLAEALFGAVDPVGRMVSMDTSGDLVKVAGVYEDLPMNTTFHFARFVLPWTRRVALNSWVKESSTRWGSHAGRLLVEINEHRDPDRINNRIKDIPKLYVKQGNESIFLYPMDKWHLYNEFNEGSAPGGRIRFVWLFGMIGIFVLLLACINFMNLSTARSESRAKEVGIRKTAGSLRIQLVSQFLTESIAMALCALLLAVLLVAISLPAFNALLTNKELTLPLTNPFCWLSLIAFALCTGLIAGSYPAFYLSGFAPAKALKGTFRTGRSASLPRKALVALQFTVSIALIIGTVIVYRQIQFGMNRPVGYGREGLVSIQTGYAGDLPGHYTALRNDLLQTSVVENMGSSNNSPTQMWNTETGFDWPGKDPGENPQFFIVAMTYEFGKTLGWQLKEGRDFSVDFSSDTSAIILNEAAVKLTRLQHPVGETIKWHGIGRRVIGVIKDMVVESPFKSANPTIFFPSLWSSYITIRLKPGKPIQLALTKISATLRKYNPDLPLNYEFADEEYASKFTSEERIGKLAAFFTLFAILISCLGLFGLALFLAERRTKEIGIRKVLGATVFQLWILLSKEFLWLVLLSFIIAAPLTTLYLHGWLQGYEYRTNISWWILAVSGAGALFISLLTVSAQSVKAAVQNPAKSLRSE